MTTAGNSRPVLGAALALRDLETHRDWILARQRDLELQDFHLAEVLDGDWKPLAERIRRLLDGYRGRLGIHGPFWGLKIDSHDPEVRAVVRKRLMQGLDVCAAVGATQMVIHSPYRMWDYNNLDNLPDARAQLTERVHATLHDVVPRAADMGCVLVLENIEDKDPRARVELAQSFDSPALRVSLDTGHAHCMHGSSGAPPVDYYVRAAGAMLDHVHVQDTDGYADRHWLPGDGTICWPAVFRALAAYTAEPRLVLEVRDPANLMKGFSHLQALGLVQ
jgi:sugar phosphate isomerase/epimerase